jgi:hypothetical protein
MANTNFIVQNGLTVGPSTVFAGNGDVAVSGNAIIGSALTVAANLTVANGTTLSANTINVTKAAGITIGGIQAATISDAQAFAIALG